MFEYSITRGAVQVADVYPVIDQDDVKVIEVDLMSKYPGQLYDAATGAELVVAIPATEHTLNVNPDAGGRPTEIRFAVPSEATDHDALDWRVVAVGHRYTVRIVFYRLPIGRDFPI